MKVTSTRATGSGIEQYPAGTKAAGAPVLGYQATADSYRWQASSWTESENFAAAQKSGKSVDSWHTAHRAQSAIASGGLAEAVAVAAGEGTAVAGGAAEDGQLAVARGRHIQSPMIAVVALTTVSGAKQAAELLDLALT